MSAPLVILGAGLAGMSAALQAGKRGLPYLLFEKQSRPGGLVRSERVNGFTFDYTGHLLHTREERTRKLVLDELGLQRAFAPVQRDSWVYSHGRFTRAPFQANLHGLPDAVIRECLDGMLKAQVRDGRPSGAPQHGFRSFERWNLEYFGAGIYKHFMEPYNTKLWGVHPSKMSTEFMGRFVPKPSLAQVFEGALRDGGQAPGLQRQLHLSQARRHRDPGGRLRPQGAGPLRRRGRGYRSQAQGSDAQRRSGANV